LWYLFKYVATCYPKSVYLLTNMKWAFTDYVLCVWRFLEGESHVLQKAGVGSFISLVEC
jgi:hypothetical protein